MKYNKVKSGRPKGTYKYSKEEIEKALNMIDNGATYAEVKMETGMSRGTIMNRIKERMKEEIDNE